MLTARARHSLEFQREVIARVLDTPKKGNPMFMIETGIEMPPRVYTGAGGAAKKYPFPEMEVGDSFYFPAKGNSKVAKRRAVGRMTASAAGWSKKLPGRKWSVRTVEGGVRVWRVE